MSELLPVKQIRLLNILLNDTIYPTLKEICEPDMSDFDELEEKEYSNLEYEQEWERRETDLRNKSIQYLLNNLF
jgi:hypothetical protein